jgi:uncharacterized membrane protein YfcA
VHLIAGAVCIGAGIGFLSGAFGKGGSAIATPLLHAIGVPAIVAIASPLPATVPSTLLASRAYSRAGHVDRRVVRIGLIGGLPAVALGAFATRWIPGGRLVIATDVILLILALRMLSHSGDHTTTAAVTAAPSRSRVLAVVTVAGSVAGLLGNSGGFLLAPLFMNVLRMDVRRALGTSLALSAFLAVPGTIVHAWLGHIDWSLTLAFGFASVPFAALGARTALRVKERSLTLAYAIGLATVAAGLLAFVH